MPRPTINLSDVQQLPRTWTATIPEDYLDVMGHMNVMWYTHLFGVATGGILKLIGLSWDELAARQGGTFALETHIRYLSEVRVGHTVAIHSRFISRSDKRLHLLHFMTNSDKQDVSATFEIVLAAIDMRTRRMAPILPHVLQQIDKLIAEHAALPWPAPACGVMGA